VATESPLARSLEALRATFRVRFEGAGTEQALRDENAKILGKKGELTAALKELRTVPADERKAIGELVNANLGKKAIDSIKRNKGNNNRKNK